MIRRDRDLFVSHEFLCLHAQDLVGLEHTQIWEFGFSVGLNFVEETHFERLQCEGLVAIL